MKNKSEDIMFRTMSWDNIPVLVDPSLPPDTIYLVSKKDIMFKLHYVDELKPWQRFLLKFKPLRLDWYDSEPFKWYSGKKYYFRPEGA